MDPRGRLQAGKFSVLCFEVQIAGGLLSKTMDNSKPGIGEPYIVL